MLFDGKGVPEGMTTEHTEHTKHTQQRQGRRQGQRDAGGTGAGRRGLFRTAAVPAALSSDMKPRRPPARSGKISRLAGRARGELRAWV